MPKKRYQVDSDDDDDILVPNGFVDVGEELVQFEFGESVDENMSTPTPKKRRKGKNAAAASDVMENDPTLLSDSLISLPEASNSSCPVEIDDDEEDVVEEDVNPLQRRTRAATKKLRGKKKARGKINSSIIDLDESGGFDTSSFDSTTPQSSFCFEDEEPSCIEPTVTEIEDLNKEVKIRVEWKGKYSRNFYLRKHQKIKEIYTHYAELEGVDETRILFSYKEKQATPNDTPLSLNIGLAPLEGGVVDVDAASLNSRNDDPGIQEDPNALMLSIQRKGMKEKHTAFIAPHEKISVLILKLSEDLNIPVPSFKLMFDGETLDPESTPSDYDIEGGECIDLIEK